MAEERPKAETNGWDALRLLLGVLGTIGALVVGLDALASFRREWQREQRHKECVLACSNSGMTVGLFGQNVDLFERCVRTCTGAPPSPPSTSLLSR